MTENKATILLLSATFFWGITFFIIQEALASVGVYAFLFWRFFIASILALLVTKNWKEKFNKDILKIGVLLGVSLFIAFATQTWALLYSLSSIVAFITGLNVIMVPFLLLILFKIKVRFILFFATFLSLFGIYFLTMSGELAFGFGEFLTLICAFFVAYHIILTNMYAKKFDVGILVFIQLVVIALLSMILSLLMEEHTFKIDIFNPTIFKALFITAFFCSFYAYFVQTKAQQYLSATKTAIILTGEPIFAFLYAYYIGNEVFTEYQFIGFFLIIVAMLITQVKFKRTSKG